MRKNHCVDQIDNHIHNLRLVRNKITSGNIVASRELLDLLCKAHMNTTGIIEDSGILKDIAFPTSQDKIEEMQFAIYELMQIKARILDMGREMKLKDISCAVISTMCDQLHEKIKLGLYDSFKDNFDTQV